jgi:glycosyltransferase involved in cell wall biosynthesis
MKPAISVVVNTFENPVALAKVLRALGGQKGGAFETIVADDGSGPETAEVVRSFAAKANVLHCRQDHAGFRRSVILNKAIVQAKGEYLVFLDGDSVPAREFLADHAALAEKGCWVQGRRAFVDESCVGDFEPRWSRILSLILRGKLSGTMKGLRFPFPMVTRDRGQRGILGCNLGIWRDDLVAVNGYDEAFVGWGREDADLGNRLYHLGRDRKFVYGRAIIFHLNHPVASRGRVGENQKLLEETISQRRIRARKGLDQYLG